MIMRQEIIIELISLYIKQDIFIIGGFNNHQNTKNNLQVMKFGDEKVTDFYFDLLSLILMLAG